jgi:hypothetical protein
MPIVLTVLGFLWCWPVGLLLLAFLLARGRFGFHRLPAYAGDGLAFGRERASDRWERKIVRMQEKAERIRTKMERVRSRSEWFGASASGNRAFDDYRAETLRRLEDEQREFKDFLSRLRVAKDRAEFDQFMGERRQRPVDPDSQVGPTTADPRD